MQPRLLGGAPVRRGRRDRDMVDVNLEAEGPVVWPVVWPVVAALLLPDAVATRAQAVVDSSVWSFWWAQPEQRGCWRNREMHLQPLLGNASHAMWIVLCLLKADFLTPAWAALVESASLIAVYGLLIVLVSLYPYALSPVDLGATVGMACAASWPPLLVFMYV